MDIRKTIHNCATVYVVIEGITVIISWIISKGLFESAHTYITGVPFIYTFVPSIGLVWFVEQSMVISRKRKWLIWSCIGLTFLLWLYVAIMFFFGTTIELYQNGQH